MCQDETQFANVILGSSGGQPAVDLVEQQRRESKTAASTIKQRGARLRGLLGDAYLRGTSFAQKYDAVCRIYGGPKPGENGYDHDDLMERFNELRSEADRLDEVANELTRTWDEWIQEIWVQVSTFQKKVESSTDDYRRREAQAQEYEEKRIALENAIDAQERKAVGVRARALVSDAVDDAMDLLRRQMAGDSEEEAPKNAKFETSKTGSDMDDYKEKDEGDAVEHLIAKFDVTFVSRDEANTTKDYIVKFGADKRRRIDRQGPAYDGTHAKFALQLGTDTVAGVEMQCGFEFDIQFVRDAFWKSIEVGRYIRIFAE